MDAKKCLLHCSLLFLLILADAGQAAAQLFWASRQQGNNVDETLGVATDAAGNTFATGYFSTTATISGQALSSTGLTDAFITRINANGATAWSVKAGGALSDRGLDIAVDPQGNVLVCGFYTATADFGNGISLTAAANSQDAFVAKFDAQGNALWARSGGSTGSSDRANAVATDAAGNVFITGQYTGDASFGAFSLSGTGTSNEVFVVKYSPQGTELWARSGNGPALNRGLGITTDAAGAVYACGQFSGNITFENAYPNTILNVLFVVKYDANGNEAWMRYAGGAQQSIAYDIGSDGNEVYLTGDCGQSMTFANLPGFPQVISGQENAVFVIGMSSAGNLLWDTTIGSSSPVSGRAIAYRAGALSVASWFECTFDELSEIYGASTFNNVGFRDIAVMRFNAAGVLQNAQQIASRTAEVPSGIAILPDGLDVLCGTYTDQLVMPVRFNETGPGFSQPLPVSPNPGISYCGDPFYGQFQQITGADAEDGFLIKAVDYERAPYDFYQRINPSTCELSVPDACVVLPQNLQQCRDSIAGCTPLIVRAQNFVIPESPVGYLTNYSWSSGGSSASLSANNTGNYSVIMTSQDGCYADTAQVHIEVYPQPPKPLISDDYVVNTEAANPNEIIICPDEEVKIWPTSDFPGSWVTNGQVTTGDTIVVSEAGVSSFTVQNEFGCTNTTFVSVEIDLEPPAVMDPILVFTPETDTIVRCAGQAFSSIFFDQITQTFPVHPNLVYDWSISPSGFISGQAIANTNVSNTGWYYISVAVSIADAVCWEDSTEYFVSDSMYVIVNPNPVVSISVSGPNVVCPGSVAWLTVDTSADTFNVFGTSVTQVINDSIAVGGPGPVSVQATVTNEFGCTATAASFILLQSPVSPAIVSAPDPPVICPGETVLLSTQSNGSYEWFGPSGSIDSTASVEVDEVGLYFVVVTFYEGCALVSNTLQVSEYATPFIVASSGALCPDSSLVISIFPSAPLGIQWLPPLSGNAPEQVISTPGFYEVTVESCGISTTVGIQIDLSSQALTIQLADTVPVCPGDSLIVIASQAFANMVWTPAPVLENANTAWYTSDATVQASAIDLNACPVVSNVLNIALNVPPPAPEVQLIVPCVGEPGSAFVDSPFDIVWLASAGGDTLATGALFDFGVLQADSTVFAFLSNPFCPGPVEQVSISPKPLPEVPIAVTNAPVCTGTVFTLEVLNAEADVGYSWNGPMWGGASGAVVDVPALNMDMQGTYSVVPLLDGCTNDSAFVEVTLIETRQVNIGGNTAVCAASGFVLLPDTVFLEYLWQDGSTVGSYAPTGEGVFTLFATDFNGCQSLDEMTLEWVDCAVIIPNVFTPNGDGRNDSWEFSVSRPRSFRVVVYNRWGRTVYESDRVGQWWDGTNFRSGEPCPEGVYFYIAGIVAFDGKPYELTGDVRIIR